MAGLGQPLAVVELAADVALQPLDRLLQRIVHVSR
jgi:hypothetical protein